MAAVARGNTGAGYGGRRRHGGTGVNVQTVATATEELSTSINEISRQVTESTRIAGDAAEAGPAG